MKLYGSHRHLQINPQQQMGDVLIESLISTLILGLMIVAISTSSKNILNEQRDAITQELIAQQARNHIQNYNADGFDHCQFKIASITNPVTSNGGGANDITDHNASKVSTECNQPSVSAQIGQWQVANVAIPRTANIEAKEIDSSMTIGIQTRLNLTSDDRP